MSSVSNYRQCFSWLGRFFDAFDVDRAELDEYSNQRANSILRIFLLYMLYVISVVVVAILSHSTANFAITQTFEHHLIHAKFPGRATWVERQAQYDPYGDARDKYRHAFMINFNQIATLTDVSRASWRRRPTPRAPLQIWQFLNTTIADVFYRRASSSDTSWILDHFLLLGVLRMRQVRVKPEPCLIPRSYADEISDCYPAYSSAKTDTEPCESNLRAVQQNIIPRSLPFVVGPMTLTDRIDINLKQSWRYMPVTVTRMSSYQGRYGTYDGSGYVADLAQYERSYGYFQTNLNELHEHVWLDRATRALFIDMLTYNPSVNLFSSIRLIFEMPFTGGIFPSYKIESRQLLRVTSLTRRNTAFVLHLTFSKAMPWATCVLPARSSS